MGVGSDKKDPNAWYIFFGKDSEIESIRSKYFNYCYELITPSMLIDSCLVEYHDKHNVKKEESIFLIQPFDNRPNHKFPKGDLFLIMPEQKICFDIHLNGKLSIPGTRYKHLRKTAAALVQKMFILSEDPSFWHSRYTFGDTVSFTRNVGEHVQCELQVNNSFFEPELVNSLFLESFFSHHFPCACDTGYIDQGCQDRCNKAIAIAQDEKHYALVERVKKCFIEHHIVHEIKNESNDGHDQIMPVLYTNAWGDILSKTLSDQTMKEIYLRQKYCKNGRGWRYPWNEDSPFYESARLLNVTDGCAAMQHQASENALLWRIMGNMLFCQYKNHKDEHCVYYVPLVALSKGKSTLNGHQFIIDNQCSIGSVHQYQYDPRSKPIIVFRVCNSTKDTDTLVYCMPFGCYDGKKYKNVQALSLDDLKMKFSLFIGTNNEGKDCHGRHHFMVEASKKVVDSMLVYHQELLHNKQENVISSMAKGYTLLNFNAIPTSTYEANKDSIVKFIPTNWLDKLWYGFSPCSIYGSSYKQSFFNPDLYRSDRAQWAMTAFFAGSIIASVWSINYSFYYPVGIFLNTLLNEALYETENFKVNNFIYYTFCGTRLAAMGLFTGLGHSLFSGLLPRLGCAMLPFLRLGYHAYRLNQSNATIEIPFYRLYNSWPARMRRLLGDRI